MDINGLSALLKRMSDLAIDVRQIERPLKTAGAYMLGSIEKNFQSQGRPKRWTPLSPRTLKGRRKGRTKKRSSLILIDRARLKNSMSQKVTLAAGGAGRGHSKTPSREFLLFQDPEDYDAIGGIFNRHIARQ
jgi:phage gpG-like protein